MKMSRFGPEPGGADRYSSAALTVTCRLIQTEATKRLLETLQSLLLWDVLIAFLMVPLKTADFMLLCFSAFVKILITDIKKKTKCIINNKECQSCRTNV